MSGYSPPRWFERVLERMLPEGLSSQGTLGDLAEEFERRALKSALLARLWYARQTLSIVTYRVLTGEGTPGSGKSGVQLSEVQPALIVGPDTTDENAAAFVD